MIRNFKTLGLALVAVLALSAVAASAASAQQGKLTSDGPVTLTGTENAGTTNALTAFGLTVKCPGSTYTGHKVLTHTETTGEPTAEPPIPPKTHELLPNGSTTATITPHYKQVAAGGDANCRATPGDFPVTIHMNGCDYVIHLGVTTGVPVTNTYGVTYDIVCPPGKEITLTAWTTDHEHTTSGDPNTVKPFCVIHVPSQTNLAGGHVTDTTNGTLDLNGMVEGISLTRTNNTGVADTHTVLCPESTSIVGKFDINATVIGDNGAGGSTSIGISE
jgi:hypothetical protein